LALEFLLAVLASQPIPSGDGIALVLSGGGARGLAHVGVLLALEEEGVPVRAVAGTSMGALVGGLYACGWSAIQIDSIARSIDWGLLFSATPRRDLTTLPLRLDQEGDILTLDLRGLSPVLPGGAFSTLRVSALLASLTGFRQVSTGSSFDSLPIPLRIVSFDIESRRMVVCSEGVLARAMLASMAIPSVFPAVRIGDSLLIDGGVVDNMPVDVARKTWDLPVLAIDVSSPSDPVPEDPSLLQTGSLTLDALTSSLNALHSAPPDYVFRPDLGSAKAWSFGDAESLIAAGYRQALRFLDANPGIPRGRASHYSWHPRPLILHDLLVGGLRRSQVSAVFPWIDLERGDTLTPARIREASELLCASDLFTRVEPELRASSDAGGADLLFRMVEKEPSSVGVGMTYSSDFGLDGRVTFRNSNFLDRGRRFVLSLGGGDNYAFGETSILDNSSRSKWFQQFSLSARQLGEDLWDREGRIGSGISTTLEAELAAGISLGWFGLTQAGLSGTLHWNTGAEDGRTASLFLRGLTQTLDDPAAPGRGSRLLAEIHVDPFQPGQILDVNYLAATHVARRSIMTLEGAAHLCAGRTGVWQYARYDIDFPMPGYPWGSMPARERVAAALSLTRRLRGPFFLSGRTAVSWDWDALSDPGSGEAVYGAGISAGVRTPAGPAAISWGRGSGGRTRWIVTIGAPGYFGPGR